MYALGLFLLISLWGNEAGATHLMGSDMTWKCKGKDTYDVVLTIYKDCNGITLEPTRTGGIQWKACGATTITQVTKVSKPIVKEITPTCKKTCTRCSKSSPNNNYSPNPSCKFQYGIEQISVTARIILTKLKSNCCDVKFFWEDCCRNNALTTLQSAGSSGFYVEATLNRCLPKCDN